MPPRNYIRILPDLYDRKALGVQGRRGKYPPVAFAAYIGVLCMAEQQPTRGVFASEKLLRVLLEGPHNEGRIYARQIPVLISMGDLVHGPGGSLIVAGWQELQEGNWQAAERMARYRERQRDDEPPVTPRSVTRVTSDTVTPVTEASVTVPSRGRVPRGRAGFGVEGEGEGEGDRSVTASVTPRGANGAKPHGRQPTPQSIEQSIQLAKDETKPASVRRAARRAVERHAPERLGELGAPA